jgi:hypothetical protein
MAKKEKKKKKKKKKKLKKKMPFEIVVCVQGMLL